MDTDELTIVIATAAGATPLERDGVLRRLEEAVGQAIDDHAPHGYITHGTSDPAEIHLVIDAPALATPPVLSLVGDTLNTLMTDPDLLGWGPFSVKVTDETPDDTDDDDDAADVHLGPIEPVDPEPQRRRLREAASHLADTLDPRWLTPLDVDAGDPDQSARAEGEATYIAGALFTAAVVVVDYLFADLETLTDADETATVATTPNAAFFIVDALPQRYAHHYNILFIKQMIVATIDVTRHLTAGWEPLACLAEELALRLILDETQDQLDLADLHLTDTWRDVIEDALYEDTDYEILYDPGLDGAEDDTTYLTHTGATNLAFTEWFTPFNDERPLPPYLLDRPGER